MNKTIVRPALIVCGVFGSGKTTVAKRISALLGIPHVSTGAIFRQIADERGMTPLQLGIYYEEHPELDLELDDRVLAEVAKGECIADGRVTAALARKRDLAALTVRLVVEPAIGAARVAVREGKPVALVLEENRVRESDIARRLKALYDVDAGDDGHYDLTIRTDDCPVEQVVGRILDAAHPLGYPFP